MHIADVHMGVNYGLNRVRFPAPVLVDSRLRAHLVLRGYKPLDGGAELVLEVTVEREGQAKPVCVAESVTRPTSSCRRLWGERGSTSWALPARSAPSCADAEGARRRHGARAGAACASRGRPVDRWRMPAAEPMARQSASMKFEPAIDPLLPATTTAWHLVFVDGKLLPEDEAAALSPVSVDAFGAPQAPRHFLGRLDALDCWTLRLAGEIEDAQWVALDALPAIPPRFSISGHMIRGTAQVLADAARPGR